MLSCIIKADGELIVFEHNTLNPVTRKMVKDCPFDEDAILLPSGETKQRLKNAGFSDLKIRYTIFLPRKAFFKKLLWIEKWLWFIPAGGGSIMLGQKSN